MFIIKHRKIFVIISIALVVVSILAIFVFGLKIGIDFKGGALTEVSYENNRPEQVTIEDAVSSLGFGTILIQPAGEKEYIIKSRDLNEKEHNDLLDVLSINNSYKFEEKSFNSIGPSVGRELTRRALLSIVLVSLAIIIFIAYAFRKVSKPVSSWKYGIIAIVTLLHDVLIPVGIFTILSKYYGAEVDTLFVVAILTILGVSVSDTIVIFDRIRENLRNHDSHKKIDFKEIVGRSVGQSFVRSISTSLTVILVLLALVFFGPITTKYFALMIMAGMFFGTYSSIFLASPLLTYAEDWQSGDTK
ncbi:MAG: Protein-export rane protein SecF [Patescibacteria group bacterium]|nr:Protein-export rane protein SecF [Patescibacteria group bacterium]